jgi:hypothetical protein
MCMQASGVRPYQRWHWAGDEIIQSPVVPASRPLPGSKRKRYPIDLREFLSIEDDAVVRQALRALVANLSPKERSLLAERAPGTFDLRARRVAQWVGSTLRYRPGKRSFDTWMFPAETLALGGGDCEDLSFAMAALLEASGISPYCLRVALGSVRVQAAARAGRPRQFDHAWVVYLDEGGSWQILEPLTSVRGQTPRRPPNRRAPVPPVDVEYIPHYVFNRTHLWAVRSFDGPRDQDLERYLRTRAFWERFTPRFALGVHDTLFDRALYDMPDDDLDLVKRTSLAVDVNVLAYDPRDHFDFAYVDEGWKRVQRRLATRRLRDFGLAAHAIADFYAHTLYGEVGPSTSEGGLTLYDPAAPPDFSSVRYDFSRMELPGCRRGATSAAATWSGRLISGQWWRWYTTFPDELEDAADFGRLRRCLPDHDALAVDSSVRDEDHARYTPADYQRQFALRYAAAQAHIRQVFLAWKQQRSPRA